jgi:Sulfatase
MARKEASSQKPNILVIWGDDIGISNLSCYTLGLMGYKTPNIDRPAKEGMIFTDSYGEQSCTAGRSSFITGQSGYRTGLTKVGVPGSPIGLSAEDPTIAELLKPLGYDVILPELKAAIRDHIRYLRVIALETIPQVFGNHGKAAERPIPTKPLSEALDRTGYDAS